MTKLNATRLNIVWTKSLGSYDVIKLVCKTNQFETSSIYSEDSVSGECDDQFPFSGKLIKISLYVKKRDKFHKTDTKNQLIGIFLFCQKF